MPKQREVFAESTARYVERNGKRYKFEKSYYRKWNIVHLTAYVWDEWTYTEIHSWEFPA